MDQIVTNDFQLRFPRLLQIINTAKEVMHSDDSSRLDHARYVNRLQHLIPPIAAARPPPESDAALHEYWNSKVVPVLLDAEETISDLRTLIEDADRVPVAQHPKPSAQSVPRYLEIKCPTFEGDYADYATFIAAFKLYVDHTALDGAHKFLILQQHLKGKASLFVTGMKPSDESYTKALKALDETFNQRTRIIDALERKLFQLPNADDTAASLRDTYMKVESILRALENNDVDVDSNDTYRKAVLRKYPQRVRDIISPTERITVPKLRSTILKMVENREDVENAVSLLADSSISPTAPPSGPAEVLAFAGSSKPSVASSAKKCNFCDGEHWPSHCKKYKTSEERLKSLPQGSCIRCLSAEHSTKECPDRPKCFYCKRRTHNSAYCPAKFGNFNGKTEKSDATDQSSKADTPTGKLDKQPENRTANLASNEKGILLTVRAILENTRNGRQVAARVFLDPGSDSTYVLQQVKERLELTPVDNKHLLVNVFLQAAATRIHTDTVELVLRSENDEHFRLPILADTVDMLPSIVTYDPDDFKKTYPLHDDLCFADPANDLPVSLIIGVDYFWPLVKPASQIQVTQGLYLIDSQFGWLISGRISSTAPSRLTSASVHETVSKLWALESIGIKDPDHKKDEEEEMALQNFNRNITYDEETHRYEVTWPWREYPPNLPSNYGLAIGVLRSLVKRSPAQHLDIANRLFEQQLQTGIIERVEDDRPQEGYSHYLPYHFIIKEGKSTPLRPVYNGSARARSNALSLNDCLFKGINLLPGLVGILLRLRFGSIVCIADIEKAFHQIGLKPSERDYLRFLTVAQEQGKEKIITYRFKRVPFGIVSSPFILAATLQHILRSSSSKFAELILRNLYVDNLVLTFDSVPAASELYSAAVSIFADASLNLRQWNSNSAPLRESFDVALRDDEKEVKILGISWNRDTDLLRFPAPQIAPGTLKNTMRSVLKLSAQVFDPLGFFSPVTVRAKLLLRSLHERSSKWDDPLTDEELRIWKPLYEDLRALANITVPRMVSTLPSSSIRYELHVFCDASKAAYASASYVRIEHLNGTVVTRLLFAKARPAPIKKIPLTIPRLELLGAVLGSRLLRLIREELQFVETAPAILWLDSRCVIAWLSTATSLTTFVRNRVSEIRKTPNLTIKYVQSRHNIADLPTRACSTEDLRQKTEWWAGPSWLALPPSKWPADRRLESSPSDSSTPALALDSATIAAIRAEIEPEERKTSSTVQARKKTPPFGMDPTKFNSYTHLIRITARCVFFVRKTRPKSTAVLPPPASDYEAARHLWIKAVQEDRYGDEIQALRDGIQTKFIKQVRPFMDTAGLMRYGGRFRCMPFTSENFPLILPKASEDHFARLVVLQLHTELAHSGTQTTLARLQRRYWMPCGRREVHRVILKCRPCAREEARPYTQPTYSNLPAFRLDSDSHPFASVGIDTCGPFTIQKQKRYILLTTCLVVRAVALEVLDSLETHHVHAALRRIAARRARPSFYVSDNAPQFLLIRNHICRDATSPITWKFLPQHSPWQGGVYERMNRHLKTALYRCMRPNVPIGDVQFRTIVAEIEHAINSRPLTYVDADPTGRILTPNHFLFVQDVDFPSPESIQAASDSQAAKTLARLHRASSQLLNEFWRDWMTLYLSDLRSRPATQQFQRRDPSRTPRLNDVVVIRDNLRRRAHWKLGMIVELPVSADGVVRHARVKLGTGNVTAHPLNELYPLELSPDDVTPPINPIPPPDNEDAASVQEEVLGLADLEEINQLQDPVV